MIPREVRRVLSGLALVMGGALLASHVAVAQHTVANERSLEPEAVEAILSRPVTIRLDHVSLRAAVIALSDVGNVHAQYRRELLDAVVTPVTLHATRMTLGAAFESVLSGTMLQAVPLTRDVVSIQPMELGHTVVTGVITGVVTDRKTKRPLRGAIVVVDDTSRGFRTTDAGAFRIDGLSPGVHRLSARLLGYVKQGVTVTVQEGQSVTIDLQLEPSANALDQVIVTGTVVETARREVPNAMTVITAKEIEQRGITHIDQLFRGDVPGLFALNLGSNTSTVSGQDKVVMFSRGATSLNETGTSATAATNSIKTYVDGVELADPSDLNQIDPQSIERIEILTGPQASTLYGSNAINGVMQVFTKRGTTNRPTLNATLLSGLVQNNFSPALTPQHDYSASVNGSDRQWSYNVGGSWNFLGAWTPSKQTERTGGFGGIRTQMGPISVDATARLSTTESKVRGASNQGSTAARQIGRYTQIQGNGIDSPQTSTLDGQTLGVTLGYAPTSWWSHEVELGRDMSDVENVVVAPTYRSPASTDTLLRIATLNNTRTSLRYVTTMRRPLTAATNLVVIVGADHWNDVTSSIYGNPAILAGTLGSNYLVQRQPGRNTGAFVQGQWGIGDALFITSGLRAEWNPNYGDAAQPNYAPRYGVAYTREIGPATLKLRASYGRSTRPPSAGQKFAQLNTITDYTNQYGLFYSTLANPDLGPEFQQGGEGGLEFYFGSRASLVVTRYNQTVDGLIAQVNGIDSVRSLQPNPTTSITPLDANGYGYERQGIYENVGSIRNEGWELQSTLNAGPLTGKATYSWTQSRFLGLTFRGFAKNIPLILGDRLAVPGASFLYLPEHTWSVSLAYTQSATTLTVTMNGIGQLTRGRDDLWNDIIGLRLKTALPVYTLPNGYSATGPGYAMADMNVTHRFTRTLDAVLQIMNLTDSYQNDFNTIFATLGRQMKAGFRIHL